MDEGGGASRRDEGWLALSPLDGRYTRQTGALPDCWSEWALMRERVAVEVEWLIALGDEPAVSEIRPLTAGERDGARLLGSRDGFDAASMARIKDIERTTNHDVKAVEYYLRERFASTSLADVAGFVHVALTSEDVNNLAHARMLRDCLDRAWLPSATALVEGVAAIAMAERATPMLARTHGQPATPTTLGKELAVFVHRWRRQIDGVRRVEILGKLNGAVGTYGAHTAAWPDAPWVDISRRVVTGMGLVWNPLTTQIESHDAMAEVFAGIARFNTILLDFDADIWTYVSLGYFRQRVVAGEVGSSTMPHKVNPINFENSEANAGISNALLSHLQQKLPVSRLQRDLSDSSALRNVGVALGHGVVAVESARAGVGRLAVAHDALQADLDHAWETLGEAVQTVLRKHGHIDPYERLKELTRGVRVTRESLHRFVTALGLPADDERRILAMEPANYTGLADHLVSYIDT